MLLKIFKFTANILTALATIYFVWFCYYQFEYSRQEKVEDSIWIKDNQNRQEFFKLLDEKYEIKRKDFYANTDSLDIEMSKKNQIGKEIQHQKDSIRVVMHEINSKSTLWVVR